VSDVTTQLCSTAHYLATAPIGFFATEATTQNDVSSSTREEAQKTFDKKTHHVQKYILRYKTIISLANKIAGR
jgi:hypothetical protein